MNLRGILRDGGQLALCQMVARLPGAALERMFGNGPALRGLAEAMARGYRPEVSPGFAGTVVYTLTRPRVEPVVFILRVIDGQASAALGPPVDGSPAAVRVTMPVADFLRIVASVVDPAEPLLQGRATFTGELALAARLPEMFGAPRLG